MESKARRRGHFQQRWKASEIVPWVRTNSVPIVCYAAFALTYLALSWVGTPHVIDNYPDSHTYLPISFLGHADRLWTIPVIYFAGSTSAGRVVLQTLIGVACWTTLAIQIGRMIHKWAIRLACQVFVLMVALTAPVIQWNRVVLSESIAISLTVLLFAAWLAFARRMDARSVAALLVVMVLWTFTRQDQAFVGFILLIPFAFVAWLRPEARRIAVVGLLGVALIAVWGTATTLQGSKPRAELQLAGIVQFRAATNPAEMTYLWNHGMPRTSALKLPPPFTTVGQPVNVTQFADPFAQYELGLDPQFKRWADATGDSVLIKYLVTHPWTTVSQALVHAPQLMTMNPDYIRVPALPQWVSTAVYGNLSSLATPDAPWGPPRSSDPIYLLVVLGAGAVLFVLSAVRRQLSRATWVALGGLAFAAVWTLAIWNLAATELPREFIPPAVLVHIAVIVLIATCLDSILAGARRNQRSQAYNSPAGRYALVPNGNTIRATAAI
jgi:hypothetical protein